MNSRTLERPQHAGGRNIRPFLVLASGMAAMAFVSAGTPANAKQVSFRYVGGRWSHARHAGWHRYWGGPEIGFYYAPTPVYIVPGYESPSYYAGPDYWTSNPSFGLSLNFGGGGYYGSGYYPRRYYAHRYYNNGYYGRPHGSYRTYHNYGGSTYHNYGGSFRSGHTYNEGSFGRGRR